MRYIFAFLFLVHGLIHLMGFAKAFKFAEISQLKQPISRPEGAFWLLSAVSYLVAASMLFLKMDVWWIVAALALIISQGLVIRRWHDAKFGTIANVIVLIATIIGYCTWNYYHQYKLEVNKTLAPSAYAQVMLLTEADLAPLPKPVQQYLRFAGVVGKPKVQNFKVEFSGKIRKNEQSEWMPFTSEQYNFMDTPTRLFFMKASMKNLPVAGFHSFTNGNAFMDIRLFSLFKVQFQSGKEMGIAETVTFFNDMCCMAPATLIDNRIQWLEVAEDKVKASFTNNGITIYAWLFFNKEGALINFSSEDRYASMEDHSMQQLPWSTPLKEYKTLNGYQVPGYAETIYHYPKGDLCYGTFRVINVEYNPK